MSGPPTRYLIVVPLYNHARGVAGVLRDLLFIKHITGGPGNSVPPDRVILVVDDGSTDNGPAVVEEYAANCGAAGPRIVLLRHGSNQGKGVALLSAAAWAEEHGFTHLITLDADGQHLPADIPELKKASENSPQAIVVGARDFSVPGVPAASKFGRSFSGFWMRVQTGISVADMQSGFRVYPTAILRSLKFTEKRFAFEMEVLVKAAWSGFTVLSIPVGVHYPPAAERVSHFHFFYDNLRITWMNTKLTLRALLPLPFTQREFARGDRSGHLDKISVLHPVESLRRLLLRSSTPFRLAVSTGAAVLISVLPLPGLQSILLLLVIGRFHLNRVWTLAVHHALWTPLVAPVCIEAGYFLRSGRFLVEFSWETLTVQAPYRLLEWLLGGLTLGPLLAFCSGLLVYVASWRIRTGLGRSDG